MSTLLQPLYLFWKPHLFFPPFFVDKIYYPDVQIFINKILNIKYN